LITEIPDTTSEKKSNLLNKYLYTRKLSEKICASLKTEDYVVQPITDVSPPKWHLGHTTWFFETFILLKEKNYRVFHEKYSFIFNSYYETVGQRVVRADRGNLSRPTVEEIYEYRRYVDKHIRELLDDRYDIDGELQYLLEVGINHEQQHQELLITDIKYILGHNPLYPEYSLCNGLSDSPETPEMKFIEIEGGVYQIGHSGNDFCYDNEVRNHKVHIDNFEIANRVISNREYLEFILDGGYEDFNHWLAEGWDWINGYQIKSPLYWQLIDGIWCEYTLKGLEELKMDAPVTHISFFEADAYATWKKMRLPTEFEWEAACKKIQPENNNVLFLESECFHPDFRGSDPQFLGNVWEWTSSAYLPYPGFEKASGALGEYNGKFMVNQKVLRGGSVASPFHHIRTTYRNFFQPHLRWQFTGIRLAK